MYHVHKYQVFFPFHIDEMLDYGYISPDGLARSQKKLAESELKRKDFQVCSKTNPKSWRQPCFYDLWLAMIPLGPLCCRSAQSLQSAFCLASKSPGESWFLSTWVMSIWANLRWLIHWIAWIWCCIYFLWMVVVQLWYGWNQTKIHLCPSAVILSLLQISLTCIA